MQRRNKQYFVHDFPDGLLFFVAFYAQPRAEEYAAKAARRTERAASRGKTFSPARLPTPASGCFGAWDVQKSGGTVCASQSVLWDTERSILFFPEYLQKIRKCPRLAI